MPCFPFFVDLSQKQGIIVGGGIVALRKIEKLLPYCSHLKVIAPQICGEIRRFPQLECVEREFFSGDEQDAFFVIAATDDAACNHRIAELCKQQRILVNVVDEAEECSFLFPALVQKGNLTVGISTGGSSPTAAICLKEQIAELIPDRFDEILEFLHEQRDVIKKEIPNEQARHMLLKKLFFAAMEKGEPLQDEEVRTMLQKEELQ